MKNDLNTNSIDTLGALLAQIKDLTDAIAAVDKQHEDAKKGIAADELALAAPQTGREAQLEVELAKKKDKTEDGLLAMAKKEYELGLYWDEKIGARVR